MSPRACVFCRILRRELPAAVVHEDDEALVFLDHQPLFAGHCLVVDGGLTAATGQPDFHDLL